MTQKSVSEKQKLILTMTYTTYYLPIDVLRNFPHTFSDSNIQYKLIPRLIQTGLIKRVLIGYNSQFGANGIQKGKGIYDTLQLTKKGIAYVKQLCSIDKNSKLSKIRYFYFSTIEFNKSPVKEERIKRAVLCDYMFSPESIFAPILEAAPLKPGAIAHLQEDFGYLAKFRYFRALECKKVNGDLGTLENLGTFINTIGKTGLALSGSKFFGIIKTDNKIMPIYEAGYSKNVRLVPERENDLIGKLTVFSKKPCNDSVYLYHSIETIKRLIERNDVEAEWKKQTHIIDIFDYQRIYLIPYGRNNNVPFEHLQIQMSMPDKDMIQYWIKNDCFDFHNYILANPYVNETHKNLQEQFISIDENYNYIIGYLPELRHLRKIYRYYMENPNAKPLVIVCDKTQIDFFKTIFEKILEQDKLNFSCSQFCVGTSDNKSGGDD